MAIHPRTIYTKTPKGVMEAKKLDRASGKLFVTVDGKSTVTDLAKKSGIDARRMREALLGGFAASRVLEVHGERILNGNYKPGFKTALFAKDLKIASSTLADNQVPAPISAAVRQLVTAQMAAGGGEEDYSAMAKVILDLARLD